MAEIKSKGFMLYIEDEEIFEELTPEEAKGVIMACFAFHNRGEDNADQLDGFARRAFILIKRNIIRDTTNYVTTREKRQAGLDRWNAQRNVNVSLTDVNVSSTPQTKTQSKTQTEALAEAQTSAKAETKSNTEPFRLVEPAARSVSQKTVEPVEAEKPKEMTRAEFEAVFAYMKNPELRKMAMDNALEKGHYKITDENSGDL